MIKKTVNVMMLTATVLLLNGCSNLVDSDEVKTNGDNVQQVATTYFENSIKMDSMKHRRSAEVDDYPACLYELDIVDEYDNKISFGELSESDKQSLYVFWKESEVDVLIEKMNDDPSLVDMLSIENQAFAMTENSTPRSLMQNPEVFFSKYQKNLQKILLKNDSRSAKGKNTTITVDCNVESSVNKMHQYYKKGRLMVCTDTTSSSGSSFVGHASIMRSSEWHESWNKNALGRATVTSYPKDKNAMWPDKTDGVQYEPIGIWTGNSGGSSRHVTIYDVGHSKWVWNWFKSHYEFKNAPTSAYNAAADFAISQIGKKYNWNFMGKDIESSYYCSSLCYKSWRKQSSDYDVSWGFIASPSDIATSHNTRAVCSYSNW